MSIKATVLRLIQRQTREQYQIIEAVDIFGRSVAANSPDEQIALHEALSASRSLIARNPNPSRQLLTEMGWSPLEAAALFILRWCRQELESGVIMRIAASSRKRERDIARFLTRASTVYRRPDVMMGLVWSMNEVLWLRLFSRSANWHSRLIWVLARRPRPSGSLGVVPDSSRTINGVTLLD